MKRHTIFTCVGLAVALASGAAWAASGKTSDDTAPATPGIGSPPVTDTPGASGAHATDPTGANGALDMRHVDKKPAEHPKRTHPALQGTQKHEGTHTPAKP